MVFASFQDPFRSDPKDFIVRMPINVEYQSDLRDVES